MSHNVPVQSLIGHIKTAVDVDPWAKEMAEELLKEHEPVKAYKGFAREHDGLCPWWYVCGGCEYPIDYRDNYCRHCGKALKWDG